jgi:acetylglutamate kinase
MNRLDLIIDALEGMCGDRCNTEYNLCQASVALAAARELKALKPVGYMDSRGILFNKTTHPQLNTPLYAFEVTK